MPKLCVLGLLLTKMCSLSCEVCKLIPRQEDNKLISQAIGFLYDRKKRLASEGVINRLQHCSAAMLHRGRCGLVSEANQGSQG